jgi:5-methyltetrahydrofolate--homocysteine methyltransferase
MKKSILEAIKGRFYLDGGTGSMFVKLGVGTSHGEIYNIENPALIKGIHENYFAAGSDAVCTNTFGCNRLKADLSRYTLEELISSAVENAAEAAEKHGGYVLYDCGPVGELLYPYGRMTFDEAYNIFAEQAEIVAKLEKVDAVIIETVSDLQEMRAAVLAFKEKTRLPVFASMTFEAGGRTFAGVSAESFGLTVQGLGVSAFGLNCGTGAEEARKNAKKLCSVAHIPVFIKPNAGMPRYDGGKTVYDVGADDFAAEMRLIALDGVGILGGCCGTDETYIEKTVAATKDVPVRIFDNRVDAVCSYSTVKKFRGGKTFVIGERVNPTNKPLLKQAILDGDYDYVLSMCVDEAEQGADMLDINLGMAGIDETEKLRSCVSHIQAAADLPLVIDTSDKRALAEAVRVTDGVCVINSVNGEKESAEKVFPIAAKYGCSVIALCMDERGIPAGVDGRIEIAERIISEADKYGVGKERLLFDPLTLAVSVDNKNAAITLKTIERLHKDLGVKTTLGLSNVSFGLPNRAKINAAFYKTVIGEKVAAAIINPSLRPKSDAAADRLLAGLDDKCAAYIAENTVREQAAANITEKDAAYCIGHGLTGEGLAAVKAKATKENYSEVINKDIVGGLNKLGVEYEAGRAFLPQLIAGSETAKAMLGYIKSEFMADNLSSAKATVILATVKGDVHDIGKNIVKAVVANYGYRIIDLGKDVPAEEVLAAVEKYKPKFVGLSALMTTTLANMTETVFSLKKRYPSLTVVVGGAVVTESYAESVGAVYCKDALDTAKKLDAIIAAV